MTGRTNRFYLIALLLSLWLAACTPDTGSGTATATPPPTATAVTLTQPIATLTPTQLSASIPTLSATPPPPSPTMTPAPQSRAISYNGIHFTYDPALGDVYTRTESIGEVNFTRFSFAPDGLCRKVGCVDVDPVGQYKAAFPDRPLPPLGAATILRAQDQPLSFQNGDGARSIRMRGQDIFFANNEALLYEFQGFTEDGRFYVLVTIPLDAPILPSTYDPAQNTNPDALPLPAELPTDYPALADLMGVYNQDAEQQLEQLAAADFTPDLTLLDELVASIWVDTAVANTPGGKQP